MKIVIDIPDKYLFKWSTLKDELGYPDMDSFILSALGIGVQTIAQACKNMRPQYDNVIPFNQEY